MRVKYLLLIVLLLGFVSIASAETLIPDTTNTSAEQMGGLYNGYSFQNGADTVNVITSVPLTVQDVAYPTSLWDSFWWISWGCLILGVVFVSKNDNVPSIAITACGLLAFGGFLICAFMLPYVADIHATTTIMPARDLLGNYTANNTIYITQVANYVASPVLANLCYGLSVAGFIEAVLGTLSFIGWFHRKGIKDAKKGKYVETDVDGDEPQRGKY